ncbi:flavodoxin family protein [Actinoplanes siamensis]|nr:flavodoxin family protein [Actinoplanes siamensis]
MADVKLAIVYYSATGTVHAMAKRLARRIVAIGGKLKA